MASTYSFVLIALCSLIYFNDGVKANCGGLIEEAYGTITSPNYPEFYPSDQECLWEIKMPPNKKIWFHFKKFHLEYEPSCSYDSVTVMSKKEDGTIREYGRFCGSQSLNSTISDTNVVLVHFKSDPRDTGLGFAMDFFKVPFECGGSLEESEGIINSPGYPLAYPPNLNCTWNIKAPLNRYIKLSFEHFVIEVSSECVQEYVAIQSKMAGEIQHRRKLCGRKDPFIIFSETNILQMKFVSHNYKGNDGFKAKFISEECGGVIEKNNGSINSLFFPTAYPPDVTCEWTILVPLHHIIKLNFLEFDIEESGECAQEYVTVESKMLDQEIRGHGKFCGTKAPPSIVSESDTLLVKFLSHTNKGHLGFNATFTSDECGGVIQGGRGNISSPFFPDLYPPNTMCEWSFLVPPQHKIKLNFKQFEIEEGKNCPNDFLQVKGESSYGIIFDYGKYCGDIGPSSIISKDKINMKFVSDRSIERKGFTVEYFIDKLTVFESSVSFEKSTFPVHEATTTPVNEATTIPACEITTTPVYEATSTPFYETTTITPVYEATTTPFYETTTTTPDREATTIPDDDTKDFVTSKKEKIIFSDVQILKKKVADLEERQKMIINNYENMFKKVSKLLSSKNASFVEKALLFN